MLRTASTYQVAGRRSQATRDSRHMAPAVPMIRLNRRVRSERCSVKSAPSRSEGILLEHEAELEDVAGHGRRESGREGRGSAVRSGRPPGTASPRADYQLGATLAGSALNHFL